MRIRLIAATAAVILTLCDMSLNFRTASAEINQSAIRIMVLNDQSSLNSAASGEGSVMAARLAAEDMGSKIGDIPIEVIGADHQSKADIGSALARKAFDADKVDAIFDFSNSAVSLAVQELARARGKVIVHVGSAHADLFGKACAPTSALWLYDTYSLAQGLVKSVYEDGGTSWFFMTSDYAFGKAMEAASSTLLGTLGGKVVGTVRHPPATADFSSFLLQAQAVNPKVMGLASGGDDPINALKQAREFGIDGTHTKFAVFIFALNYVKALGPQNAQGLQYLSGFYWDRNESTRAFAKRFAAAYHGQMPTEMQAGTYSAVRHYLRAIAAAQSTDGLTVMRRMKAIPLDDFYAPGARLRADGRLMNDMYLLEAKDPVDIHGPWDLLKVKRVVKAVDIMRPIDEGSCPHLDEN
jgi:branched-chain amino acid transport system substrate-binding protein